MEESKALPSDSKSSSTTPASLSVADLIYLERAVNPSSSLIDYENSPNIDECEPEWVKKIEMTVGSNRTESFSVKFFLKAHSVKKAYLLTTVFSVIFSLIFYKK